MKPLKDAKEDFMREYLHAVLIETNGRTTEAARIIGWSVPNFCKLLRKYEISASSYRENVIGFGGCRLSRAHQGQP